MVTLRASQINGCAYCMDMHWKDARAIDESEQRLYGLEAWREAPHYPDRERAALEWTEALTNITEGHVPEAVYDAVRGHLSEKELADLTWAVAAINAWNRVAIAFRSEAGEYQPGRTGDLADFARSGTNAGPGGYRAVFDDAGQGPGAKRVHL